MVRSVPEGKAEYKPDRLGASYTRPTTCLPESRRSSPITSARTALSGKASRESRLKMQSDSAATGFALATSDFLRYQTLLMMARNDVRLLVIDFAEMVADEGPSELERVSGIFLAARKLAKEREIPVVLLSQLNRQVEYEPSRMPETHHLKMGGEAVAAVVLLLYYPYKYEKNGERVVVPGSLVYQRVEEYDSTSAREAKNWANKGRLYVKVGKSRFGGNSIVTLNVVPEWLLLADYDPESERSGVVKLMTRQGEHDEDF